MFLCKGQACSLCRLSHVLPLDETVLSVHLSPRNNSFSSAALYHKIHNIIFTFDQKRFYLFSVFFLTNKTVIHVFPTLTNKSWFIRSFTSLFYSSDKKAVVETSFHDTLTISRLNWTTLKTFYLKNRNEHISPATTGVLSWIQFFLFYIE